MTTNPYLGPTVRVEPAEQPAVGGPARYRKRDIPVEAIRWTSDNLEQILSWVAANDGDAHWVPTIGAGYIRLRESYDVYCRALVGDWIVRCTWTSQGVRGFTRVTPQEWSRDYEPASAGRVGYCGACGRGGVT